MKFFRKKNPKDKPGLEMSRIIPEQKANYELDESNNVVLLKPKFTSRFSQKFIIPKMKDPYYHIHLDKKGTAVWELIDGKRTAIEIGEELKEILGQEIEPIYDRLGMFLAQLKNEEFITW